MNDASPARKETDRDVCPLWGLIGMAIAAWGALILVIAGLNALTGCSPIGGLHSPGGIGGPNIAIPGYFPPNPGAGVSILGWLAGLCAVVAVVTFVLSFAAPALLISPKLSIGCIVAAAGLWLLQYILVTYLHIVSVVAVIAGGVALLLFGLPYIIAAVRQWDLRQAKGMLANGHAADGVALVSHVFNKDATKIQRFLDKHAVGAIPPPSP